MSCCSSQVAVVEAAPAPPTSTSTSTSMADLNDYFSRLMLRELDNFRAGPTNPAADTTAAAATEVADTASPPATGQADPTTPAEMADAPSPSPTAAPTTNEGEHTTKQPDTPPQPQGAAVPPAAGADSTSTTGCLQGTTHLRLLTIPNTTPRQRRNNGARQQRVYRLAAKFGVSPGAPRWVRNNRAYAQPAVPKSVVVDNANINNNKTVEYNQFMYDGSGDDRAVVLRMPGGWKRDLVRSRPQFLGVAVIDGFLWPRFSPNLARRVLVDWEEQGFVEFNEVKYTTPFVAREPRPSPRASGAVEEDGVLIRFDE